MKNKKSYTPTNVIHYNDKQIDLITKDLTSSMNNKKWKKLFDYIYFQDKFDNAYAELKLVWEDKTRLFAIPRQLDYYENGIEGCVHGFRRWCFYKEIEWVQFPKEFLQLYIRKDTHKKEPKIKHQNIDELYILLKEGSFLLDMEKDENLLKIYGYQRYLSK